MPDPFISTQDVVDYLGRGTASDPGMLIAVDAACDMVRDVSERLFNRGTATISLDGTDTDCLLVPNKYLPLNSAGTVTVQGTSEASYYVADNENGMLFRGTAGNYATPMVWPRGRRNVRLTLDYGYADADIPRSVRMVALSVAARLVVQGPAAEETVGDVRIKYSGEATALMPTERLILQKYRGIR